RSRSARRDSWEDEGPMSNKVFAFVALAVALALAAVTQLIPNDYFFTAAYTVLLFVILATAWNILGGYTGYVNFGSAAFFAIGAYTSVMFYNAFKAPLPVGIVAGTLVAGLAGTTFPYYLSYIEPSSAFSLSYAVNSIAMPLIGGMMSWMGPLIGAVLLGGVQQLVQVTVSSAWNLLIVGVLLVLFVTLAPNGIMGWVDAWRRRKGR